MITWMQKHKKWLVITIWISTIAFVGAGFVGWGSYNYGKAGGTIGTVGSIEIEMNDLQKEYSGLYNQYQQAFGATFNNEMAKQFKLEEQAYNNLVQRYLVLNLAQEFGLDATNTEIAKQLVKYESFLKDGKFDKNSYIQILRQNRTNPTDFENGLKKDITFDKMVSIFSSTIDKKEMENLNKLFFAEDNVSINIINSKDITPKYSNEDLKKYWDKNKEQYKSQRKFEVNIAKIKIGEDPKASKNEALKKYLALKNNKEQFTQKEFLDDSTAYVTKEDLDTIFKLKKDEIIKPIKAGENYIIVKMLQQIESQILPYETVKQNVKNDYIAKVTKEMLHSKKESLLAKFEGKDIGYISKTTPPSIKNLTTEESTKFVQELFKSKAIVNFVDLGDKIVVYKILDSKLASFDSDKNKFLQDNVEKIKNTTILSSLINLLQTKYTVSSSMEVK